MSYDLYFYSRKGGQPKRRAVAAAVREFPHFKINRSDEGVQYWYENHGTGVCYSIEHSSDESQTDAESMPEVESDWVNSGIRFNMNLARPSFFADEAMPIVAAIADRLGLSIVDPQAATLRKGKIRPVAPSSRDLVLSWNKHNRQACIAARKVRPPVVLGQPCSARVAREWHGYQFRKALVGRALEEANRDVFVPALMLWADSRNADRVVRAFVWPEGLVSVFPNAEVILLGLTRGKEKTMRLADGRKVRRIIGEHLRTEKIAGMSIDVVPNGCPPDTYIELFGSSDAFDSSRFKWLRGSDILDV